jgi:hypothetical protein
MISQTRNEIDFRFRGNLNLLDSEGIQTFSNIRFVINSAYSLLIIHPLNRDYTDYTNQIERFGDKLLR